VLGKDRVKLELLEGAGHGDPQFETLDNVKKVLDFIDKHMKKSPTIGLAGHLAQQT